MTNNNIKVILFASLMVAMILPFSGMDFAEAKKAGETQKKLDEKFTKISDVYSSDKMNYVQNIISETGVTKTSKNLENGDIATQKITVKKNDENSFKVTDKVKLHTLSGNTEVSEVKYVVTVLDDGSLNVVVPEAQSSSGKNKGLEFNLRSDAKNIIPDADALLGTIRLTATDSANIQNNHVTFSDSATQNCGVLGISTMSMYGSADAITVGEYWRSINAQAANALVWRDWCIIPHTYTGMTLTMAGSSYSDSQDSLAINPGWGPTSGLQFPWDTLNWKAEAYYYKY